MQAVLVRWAYSKRTRYICRTVTTQLDALVARCVRVSYLKGLNLNTHTCLNISVLRQVEGASGGAIGWVSNITGEGRPLLERSTAALSARSWGA